MNIFGTWGGTGVPGENPQGHGEMYPLHTYTVVSAGNQVFLINVITKQHYLSSCLPYGYSRRLKGQVHGNGGFQVY